MAKRFAYVESPYLVPFDGSFRVKKARTDPPKKDRDDDRNEKVLRDAIEKLAKRQSKLMAENRRALLCVFQAMDAAGKDGTVRAVMTGVNPTGIQVHYFKRPTENELDHDFLWRVQLALPQRGRIGIWNRSHYEEVLVVKVHPEILARQRLHDAPKPKALFEERYESIRDFERHVARNGTRVVKFWLNVSEDEQKKRLLERIADEDANWKFEAGDVKERSHWPDYMSAYEDALNETSRPWAPWYCIPADDKKYMRRVVAEILVDVLGQMDPAYPSPSEEQLRDMLVAKSTLEKT